MSRLPFAYWYQGTNVVTVIRGAADDPEADRFDVRAHVTPSSCILPLDAEVLTGDVIEFRRSRRTPLTQKLVIGVNEGDGVLVVTWTEFIPATVDHRRCTQSLRLLHPEVANASLELFANGHYAQAVFESAKLLERTVMAKSGEEKTGRSLMAAAFGGSIPIIDVRQHGGRSGDDEQEGLKLLCMGTMQAIRNPPGHENIPSLDAVEALECLALLSFLVRRLHRATINAGG